METNRPLKIVYIGTITEERTTSSESIWTTIENWTLMKCEFHLYPLCNKQLTRKLRRESKINPYFQYHKPIKSEKKLIQQLKQYNYASILCARNDETIKHNPYINNTFGDKIYKFHQAGLQILVHKTARTLAKHIKEYHWGMITTYQDFNKKHAKHWNNDKATLEWLMKPGL